MTATGNPCSVMHVVLLHALYSLGRRFYVGVGNDRYTKWYGASLIQVNTRVQIARYVNRFGSGF